ncbi:MAG: tungsten ABC transporter substrate-binding protein [Desulfovibrio sp.]|nr:tungsten ABC transporter substrate-binding protein [Desulfovibrio sp.]
MRKMTLALTMLLALACAGSALAAETILVGTTTSTADTGLLDALVPKILKDTGLEMRWVAVGTGKALEHGKNCDVDILMVHAPGAEKKFIEDGNGLSRAEFMYNDYVLVGPVKDPAKIKGKGVADALGAILAAKAPFASRGDDSGTHKAEQALWKGAGLALPDKESWYIGVGQGMLATLRLAAERGAYALADRGTWIAFEAKDHGKSGLAILSEGDKALRNQYSIILLPQRCAKIKHEAAKKLQAWFLSGTGQQAIADFKLEGKSLFTPNAAK